MACTYTQCSSRSFCPLTPPSQPPPNPYPAQLIDISRHRKFQQASSEPLGSDSGRAELSTIWGVRATNATSIRQMQSNADPAVAQLRQDLTGIEFIAINLPDGKEREELRQAVHDLAARQRAWESAPSCR